MTCAGGGCGPSKEICMPVYKAPVEDVLFLLNDVFHIERLANLPGFADASPDVVEAIFTEVGKFCEGVLAPLNRVGDRQGCRRGPDGSVTTPKGFGQAYRQVVAGGWIGISVPQEFGGLGLPIALTQTVNEFMASANMAFAMYPGLTQGAIAVLLTHGTAEQKSLYVPKMVAGEWTGTMNLTEPQCGTDLGLIRTKAVPQPDGSYKITGTKIFISAGEHRRGTGGHPRAVIIRGAEGDTESGRHVRCAQCGVVRLDRGEDGHPRQRHLRDEL